ncbi:MAG: phospholipid/cholesterol/gamma-HCH transport system substrate-binding protein [Pseudonocardiales bacterium]|jgi:phospholipid/cholesterol/gamma-HCH transport system substrate-binding protein|nr:phospholipid/cholesterol/gamma-HCH transport system substrate-binding protein [Pseudonocardiales bacterium]
MTAAAKYRLMGLATIGVVVALVLATIGSFNQVFTPAVDATVRADRAGLLMAPGSDVTLHGIVVGKVREVSEVSDGSSLKVAFNPDMIDQIPANVAASITAPTAFGTKFVQLVPPAVPSRSHVTDGAVIEAGGGESTEVQTVLDGLLTLLQHVDVAKLNSALGALSVALNGRGDKLGATAVQLNQYLEKLNPSLPELGSDLGSAADVTDNLADAAPDLLRVLGNLSVTSGTLVDEKSAVSNLLAQLVTVSKDGKTLLNDNGDGLITTLSTLRPTSALLARYSPMFPCLFASANQLRRDIEPVIGGEYPGIHTFTSFLPGSAGYKYPQDLPKTDASEDPSCYGGPLQYRPGDNPYPHVNFDDGTPGYDGRSDAVVAKRPPLPVLLFGDAGKGIGG